MIAAPSVRATLAGILIYTLPAVGLIYTLILIALTWLRARMMLGIGW